jgi:hypothetical protein
MSPVWLVAETDDAVPVPLRSSLFPTDDGVRLCLSGMAGKKFPRLIRCAAEIDETAEASSSISRGVQAGAETDELVTDQNIAIGLIGDAVARGITRGAVMNMNS